MTFQPMLDKVLSESPNPRKPDCILLAGGGTESYVTAKWLTHARTHAAFPSNPRVPLFLHFEMDDGLKEAVWAQAASLDCPMLFIPKEAHMLHRRPEGYIPGYRMELILRACQAAEVHGVTEIYIGDLEDDHPTGPLEGIFRREILGNDVRALEEFKHSTKLKMVELYNATYRLGHKPLILLSMFNNMSKAEVLREGRKLGCDWNLTMTCRRNTRPMCVSHDMTRNQKAVTNIQPALSHLPVQSQYVPCGECYFCKSRAAAFAEAGIEDPVAARRAAYLSQTRQP